MIKHKDKIRDAIYGFAVGDALGVPYEFRKGGTFNCDGMVGYGTHHQPAGTYSDDTSMTLATLDSLLRNDGIIDIEDMRKRFQSWLYEGKYAIDGYVFDVGNTTYYALRRGKGCEGKMDNGNGSLMRALPLAFTECSASDIGDVSAITHAHNISKLSCGMYVYLIRDLLEGEDIDFANMVGDKVNPSGYVVDTYKSVMWALANGHDYESVVYGAINLGGDTDTIGAIAGGVAGILYGVPEHLKKELRGKGIIEEVLNAV